MSAVQGWAAGLLFVALGACGRHATPASGEDKTMYREWHPYDPPPPSAEPLSPSARVRLRLQVRHANEFIRRANALLREAHQYKVPCGLFRLWLKRQPVSRVLDPWGRPLTASCVERDLVLRSAGPDGRRGNLDDCVQTGAETFAPVP